MSVDVRITQKSLFKKTLPFSVIIGDRLQYGFYNQSWRLEVGRCGSDYFTAFLPDAIARGFTVTWNPNEKRRVDLRLLSPTGREEIREFYRTVERIMRHWNAELEVDGNRLALSEWMAEIDSFYEFNTKALRDVCQRIIDEKDGHQLTFFSAKWPLTLGKEEALRFRDDADAFEAWMHERQSMEVYYAIPAYQMVDGKVLGAYVLTDGCRSIFPTKPHAPLGIHDPETGQPLECNDYQIKFYSTKEEQIIGALPYEDFLAELAKENVSRYDETSLLIEPMDISEIQKMLDTKTDGMPS